jgi:hypothetical protein
MQPHHLQHAAVLQLATAAIMIATTTPAAAICCRWLLSLVLEPSRGVSLADTLLMLLLLVLLSDAWWDSPWDSPWSWAPDAHLSRHACPPIRTLQGKIKSLEQVYLFSLAVKEYQIVDFFLGAALKDEVRRCCCVWLTVAATGMVQRCSVFVLDAAGACGRCSLGRLLLGSACKAAAAAAGSQQGAGAVHRLQREASAAARHGWSRAVGGQNKTGQIEKLAAWMDGMQLEQQATGMLCAQQHFSTTQHAAQPSLGHSGCLTAKGSDPGRLLPATCHTVHACVR